MKAKSLPKTQSVIANFTMNVILKISAFIFPLITFPYVSRVLGATGNGKIAFAASVIGYFSMFAQLGIPTYGIRVCAACREDTKKLNKTVQELVLINSITVLLVYMTFAVAVIAVPKFQDDRFLLIITSATILLNAVGMDWLFQALEQYRYITIRNLAFKILSICLMFAFVHETKDYIVYGAISVIGTCGSNMFNVLYATRFLEHRLMRPYNLKVHMKPIINFFMLTVAVSVYTSMDTVMLGFMVGDTEVGYYAAATKMKMILVSAVTALGGVLLPRMSSYAAEGKIEEFNQMIKKSFEFISLITVALTIYFFTMSDATIDFLAGDGYRSAVLPMQVISLTIIPIGFSNITGMQILVPTKREKYTTISTLIGAIINLVVNAIAIPKLAAVGAALGTVIAEVIVWVTQMKFLEKELKPMILGIEYWKILFSNAVAWVALLLVKKCLSMSTSFYQLAITAITFFGIYGLVLIGLKEKLVIEYLKRYGKKALK